MEQENIKTKERILLRLIVKANLKKKERLNKASCQQAQTMLQLGDMN